MLSLMGSLSSLAEDSGSHPLNVAHFTSSTNVILVNIVC